MGCDRKQQDYGVGRDKKTGCDVTNEKTSERDGVEPKRNHSANEIEQKRKELLDLDIKENKRDAHILRYMEKKRNNPNPSIFSALRAKKRDPSRRINRRSSGSPINARRHADLRKDFERKDCHLRSQVIRHH